MQLTYDGMVLDVERIHRWEQAAESVDRLFRLFTTISVELTVCEPREPWESDPEAWKDEQ